MSIGRVDVSASSRKLVSTKELQLQSGADRLLLLLLLLPLLLALKPSRPYRDAGIAGVGFDPASSSSPAAAANRNQFVRLIRGVTNKVTYRGVCRTSRAIYFRAARMRREQRKLVVHDVLPPAKLASLPSPSITVMEYVPCPLHKEHRTLSSGLTEAKQAGESPVSFVRPLWISI